MAARLIFVLLLVTTLAAVTAGCGGGDSPGLSAESQAAVDQIESICNDAAAKVDASRGEFPSRTSTRGTRTPPTSPP